MESQSPNSVKLLLELEPRRGAFWSSVRAALRPVKLAEDAEPRARCSRTHLSGAPVQAEALRNSDFGTPSLAGSKSMLNKSFGWCP